MGRAKSKTPARDRQHQLEPRFLELVRELGVDCLLIRQVGENAFVIVAENPSEPIDYVLSTARRPYEGREFTDFGRAVKYAVNFSGLQLMRFDLFVD